MLFLLRWPQTPLVQQYMPSHLYFPPCSTCSACSQSLAATSSALLAAAGYVYTMLFVQTLFVKAFCSSRRNCRIVEDETQSKDIDHVRPGHSFVEHSSLLLLLPCKAVKLPTQLDISLWSCCSNCVRVPSSCSSTLIDRPPLYPMLFIECFFVLDSI